MSVPTRESHDRTLQKEIVGELQGKQSTHLEAAWLLLGGALLEQLCRGRGSLVLWVGDVFS